MPNLQCVTLDARTLQDYCKDVSNHSYAQSERALVSVFIGLIHEYFLVVSEEGLALMCLAVIALVLRTTLRLITHV